MRNSQSPALKLGAFALALAVVSGASFGVARAVAPDGLSGRSTPGHSMGDASDVGQPQGGHGGGHAGGEGAGSEVGQGGGAEGGHGGGEGAGPEGGHGGGEGGTSGAAAATAPGLAVAEAGYRFVPEATTLEAGPATPFRFRLEGPDRTTVQRFEQLHERELHLIVVRRDLTGFQHVHPARAADGSWSIALDLRQAGTWRAFADFSPTGGPGQLTLGVDLQVAGSFVPGAAPAASAPADPSLAVAFERRGSGVDITVRRDGAVIEPEPYLGARGHLVALRAGDLAYLHVHPGEGGAPAVRFVAELPTPGTYALFFDYQVGGVVHTAATTTEVL